MSKKGNRTALFPTLLAALLGCCALAIALAAAPTPQTASEVTINNNQFSPKTLTVAPGTTVTWTNKEAKPHTVTADDNSFASKVLQENGVYSFKFEKVGTLPTIAPFMAAMAGKGWPEPSSSRPQNKPAQAGAASRRLAAPRPGPN